MANEFEVRRDYQGDPCVVFKNVDMKTVEEQGKGFLQISLTTELAGTPTPTLRIPITDNIPPQAVLRIAHAMLLAATGPEETEEWAGP